MKYRFIIGFLFMATVMTSCSPEVDLYADYKDIPIVYGILDSKADTTFHQDYPLSCTTQAMPQCRH
jgi:hypothetical protein